MDVDNFSRLKRDAWLKLTKTACSLLALWIALQIIYPLVVLTPLGGQVGWEWALEKVLASFVATIVVFVAIGSVWLYGFCRQQEKSANLEFAFNSEQIFAEKLKQMYYAGLGFMVGSIAAIFSFNKVSSPQR